MGQSGIISGHVSGKDTKSPIAQASVFLSNSSFGTITSANGDFTLSGLRPGQYTLVVTTIGYAEYTKTVLVTNEPIKLDIQMEQRVMELREVVISSTSRADWNRNYEQFKTEFIGSDANAKNCQVINPQVLNLSYKRSKKILSASASDFLIVENRALGYRVKFLLKDFKSDKIEGTVSYEGQRLFEELPGSAAQKKKWQLKRDLAYYGSPMHFYRSLYTDKLKEEGFEIRQLTRRPNLERPPEALIQKKIAEFINLNNRDSVKYWADLGNLSKYGKQRLSTVPFNSFEVLRTTAQTGIYAITFPDNLYVMYLKRREDVTFKDIYRPLDMPNYETSVVTLFNNPPYALFDMNGIVVGESPLYEGAWSKARLSELLPVDYVPTGPAIANLNN
jgi:hypothetical protein